MEILSGLHALDLIVVAVLLISAIAAYARGFVRELFSLAAWAGACIATYYLFDPLKTYAREFIPITLFADVGTGAAIFIVTLVVLSVITTNITRAVADSEHGALDRSVGFLFGILRGGLLVCFAYLVVSWIVPPADHPGWLREARTMPLIREGAYEIQRLIPPEIAFEGRAAAEAVDRRMREAADAERLLRLNNPAPRGAPEAAPPAGADGYEDQERRELDRLIRGTQ